MTKSCFIDLFQHEKFPVEFICYQQLKDCLDVNYIAVPWTQILNCGWVKYPNCVQSPDHYIRSLSTQVVGQGNNFTVCQHDDYLKLEPLFRTLKITKVFSPLKNINDRMNYIDILPIPFTSMFDFENIEKDILFSFVGTYTSHPIRQRMKGRIYGENIIYRDSYHINQDTFISNVNMKETEESEYKKILERSRYSLCPRGSSPSSVRFWESLNAGAIPILISDEWELPTWDWDNTIIKISEKDFENTNVDGINKILSCIKPCIETQMRDNCKRAYDVYKKENFSNYIKQNL